MMEGNKMGSYKKDFKVAMERPVRRVGLTGRAKNEGNQ
jgi:hypothetical protein